MLRFILYNWLFLSFMFKKLNKFPVFGIAPAAKDIQSSRKEKVNGIMKLSLKL